MSAERPDAGPDACPQACPGGPARRGASAAPDPSDALHAGHPSAAADAPDAPETADTPDTADTADTAAEVPLRWRGVWQRRVLAAPGVYDTTTTVRWLQTATQHADLRVPAASRPLIHAASAAREGGEAGEAARHAAWRQLAAQQGFFGRTERRQVGDREQCGWHREHDFQPPPASPDAGWMAFDGADVLIECGVHADYLEVWQRLPGSTGRHAVLARGPHDTERLLIAGEHLAWVRARPRPLPACPPGTPLADVLQAASAGERAAALDMLIVFGRWDGATWHIEHASQPHWEGQRLPLQVSCKGGQVKVACPALAPAGWRLIEGCV